MLLAEAKADGLFCYSAGGLKSNLVDTTGDSDLVVSRNGVEFFRLGTGYSTAGGAPADIVFSNAGISSSWIFGNVFAMRYEHVAEN